MQPKPQDNPTALLDKLLFPLEAAGFATIAGLARALPLDQASNLSSAAWRRLAPLNRRHQRASAQLATSMPELDEASRAKILDGMWDNLGRTTAEAFHLDEILRDPARIETGPDFDALVAKSLNGGTVVSTLHLGNWELCAPLLTRAGIHVAGIYQRIRNPHVDAAIVQMRGQYYKGGLHPKSSEAARELLRVAGKGGTVGLLGDLRDFRGRNVPFFGRPAPSSTFPALLARQRGLPLFVGKVMRVEGARFRATAIEIPPVITADRHDDIHQMTVAIQSQFEQWIRETPEQWMWGHRRWG